MAMILHHPRDGFRGNLARPAPRRSPWTTIGTAIERFVTTLLDWQERARQRRALLALGDRALQDFGRSRADAAGEAEKPVWRA